MIGALGNIDGNSISLVGIVDSDSAHVLNGKKTIHGVECIGLEATFGNRLNGASRNSGATSSDVTVYLAPKWDYLPTQMEVVYKYQGKRGPHTEIVERRIRDW